MNFPELSANPYSDLPSEFFLTIIIPSFVDFSSSYSGSRIIFPPLFISPNLPFFSITAEPLLKAPVESQSVFKTVLPSLFM
jgi:hypothetical protein